MAESGNKTANSSPGEAPRPSRRAFLRGLLALFGVGAVHGCDSASFVPERPAELAAKASPSVPGSSAAAKSKAPATSGVRRIEVILSQAPADDRKYLQQIFRAESGKRKISLGLVQPEPGSPTTPARLAEEIRKTLARGTIALALEPQDTPEVRAAIREALAGGVKILLMDRSLGSDLGKGLHTIVSVGYPERGKQLVDAALTDEKDLPQGPGGSVVLIQSKATDPYSRQRQQSLTDALNTAGRKFDVIAFEGVQEQAKTALLDYLKDHPKVTVVLTEEDYALSAALGIHRKRDLDGLPMFVLAGYASYDLRYEPEIEKRLVAFADRNPEAYARKAFQALLDFGDGKAVPELIEIPMVYYRTPAPRAPGVPVRK